jgi:hypothetical protein
MGGGLMGLVHAEERVLERLEETATSERRSWVKEEQGPTLFLFPAYYSCFCVLNTGVLRTTNSCTMPSNPP